MSYYSDPTAAKALGTINRQFSKYEKRAKAICKLYLEGKLSEDAFEKAYGQFKGIYTYVLDHALKEALEKQEQNNSHLV